MSEGFAWQRGDPTKGQFAKLDALGGGSDGVIFMVHSTDKPRRHLVSISVILPASDARRLRDWLNERYPVTETGETK